MTAIAVSFVIVALVAAVAYAAPKIYWDRLQYSLIRDQANADAVRFTALKESHDLTVIPNVDRDERGVLEEVRLNPTDTSDGQYL